MCRPSRAGNFISSTQACRPGLTHPAPPALILWLVGGGRGMDLVVGLNSDLVKMFTLMI